MPRYRGYRTDSIRLDGWDYRTSAWYFLTLCTHRRVCHFGTVRGGIVGLSPAGCVAAQEWVRTAVVRPYVRLDAWIVMPNHVHGLVGITTASPGHRAATADDDDNSSDDDDGGVETSRRDVSTGMAAPGARLTAHSIGAIMAQYKSVCTRRIREMGDAAFAWQPRFYDRIVRSRRAFDAVRAYIHANPARWAADTHRPVRTGRP